jgi:O-antigen/teichoic acid export membrane protein
MKKKIILSLIALVLLSIPFTFAYISIAEVSLMLVAVYLLLFCNSDKLIVFTMLMAIIRLLVWIIYIVYCNKMFPESRFFFPKNKRLFNEMILFAGWNLWGNLAFVLFTQGLNMLLNVFFGTAVNAARAVAVQVQGAIQQFSGNFQMAINPQIMKTYASGNLEDMHKLIFRSSRFTFLLLYILSFLLQD